MRFSLTTVLALALPLLVSADTTSSTTTITSTATLTKTVTISQVHSVTSTWAMNSTSSTVASTGFVTPTKIAPVLSVSATPTGTTLPANYMGAGNSMSGAYAGALSLVVMAAAAML